jgi:transcriptional regulator with XRE-family HTH domain
MLAWPEIPRRAVIGRWARRAIAASMLSMASTNSVRNQRGLTQQGLADAIGIHLSQVRRYEAGSSQPTLDVLKRMAVTLSVTVDDLAFGEDERGPGDDLRLHVVEAASRLDPDEQAVVRSVIEGLMLKHGARRWNAS